MIGHHQRDLQAVALAGNDLGRKCFERDLQAAVQRQAVGLRAGVLHAGAVSEVGGQCRKGFAGGRDRFGAGGSGLIGRDQPVGLGPRQHAVARRCCAGNVAVGAAGFGALRNGDEKGNFGEGQAFGFFAEIRERRGANAFQIATIGGEHQV